MYRQAPARRDPQALIAAAVLAGGPGAVASHASAGLLWGFVARWEPPPEITLTAGDRRPRGIPTHRRPSSKPQDITRRRGIRVTSSARTILDLAPRLTTKQLTGLVNDAPRSHQLRPAALRDVLDRNPFHPGTKLLRPFAETTGNPTNSRDAENLRHGLPTVRITKRRLSDTPDREAKRLQEILDSETR